MENNTLCPNCGLVNDNLPKPVCHECAFDMAQMDTAAQEPTELELFLDKNPCFTVLDYEDMLNGYGLNDKKEIS